MSANTWGGIFTVAFFVLHATIIPPNPITMGLAIGVITYCLTYHYYANQADHNAK